MDLFVQASALARTWQQFRHPLFALASAFAAVRTRYASLTLFAAVAASTKQGAVMDLRTHHQRVCA